MLCDISSDVCMQLNSHTNSKNADSIRSGDAEGCPRASEAGGGGGRGSDTPTIYVGHIDMYIPIENT